jgi:glycosyltransferase involved in cell wall biosynthesis
MNTVSVIVPFHNAEDLLGETIASILAQDFRDFRLYLVDDGSTDHTRDVAASFARDGRVAYLYQENAGQAAAINRGLRAGREPYVSLCDADDLWRADRLRLALAAIRADPSLGLVCNDFARGTDPAQPWVSAWRTLGYRPASGNAFERLLEQCFIPRSGVIIPRPVLDKVGGFSEVIGGICGSDDLDMWLRIARVRPIACLHEPLTFRRSWEGQCSRRLAMIQSLVRLWEHWVARLEDQGAEPHRVALEKLSIHLLDLAYKLIVENGDRRVARKQVFRAACCGAPLPSVARLFVRTFL